MEDESQQFSDIAISLPDIEETQIWDEENDQREVALFLKTQDGKVSGAEQVPFVLPYRWTFETLKACIQNYINRLGIQRKIRQVYYKRSGRSKSVICIRSDHDIPALLKEYPLTCPGSGRRSRRCLMVLAVDLESKTGDQSGESPSYLSPDPKAFGSQMLRRSPRLNASTFDVFLFDVTNNKKREPVVSKHSSIIHGVAQNCSLQDLKSLIRAHEDQSGSVYVPATGLFWLRKGTKQLVKLNVEADLHNCKEEYSKPKLQSIRLACVSVKRTGDVATSTSVPKRRCLQFSEGDSGEGGEDDKDFVIAEAAAAASLSNPKKITTANDVWNDTHCTLVRELEKKGKLNRYSHRHLKVWTDEIIAGKSNGIYEEPRWENFIDIVGVPPKEGRESSTKASKDSKGGDGSSSTTDDLIKAMLIQNQQRMELETKRTEVFQTSLLAILANSPTVAGRQQGVWSPTAQASSTNQSPSIAAASPVSFGSSSTSFTLPSPGVCGKHIGTLTQAEVCTFLEKNGFAQFVPVFVEAEVDGPLLISFCNPRLGHSMLIEMGIHSMADRVSIIEAIKKHTIM